MATLFSVDDASTSRMMSMSDRQSQLVLQRRQIIRQQSHVNSNHLSTNGSLRDVEASDCGNSQSSLAHHQVVTHNTDESIAAHSPSELPCDTTAVEPKCEVKKETSAVEAKSTESCDENSNNVEKENQEAINLLERELDRKKKELEQTRAKLEEKEKAEVDQLRKEKESRQRVLRPHTTSDDYDVQDSSPNGATHHRHEIANVLSTTYSSGSSIGGSDKGYQRYLDAYHNQPKNLLLTKQQSDATRDTTDYLTAVSDISDLSESRRLSATSSSRPISRASRRSQESSSSSSSFVTTKIMSSTTVPTKPSSSNTAERQISEEEAGNQEQEQHSTLFDSPSRSSIGRSLPSLTSIDSANLDDPIVMRSILMNPCPKDSGMVQCYIRRNKGSKATLGLGLYPEYRCYLRESNNSRTETFLMTAKKRAANKTSNYLISMGRNDHDKDSKNILGKLRGSFHDTEYILYDNGKNPEDYSQDGKNYRIELGSILYAPSSSLGSKGPRTISVGISNLDEDCNPVKVWQPLHKKDSMMDYLKKIDADEVSSKDNKLLVHLQSKSPAWDEALERFFLNFNGRVTMASVKNFQLVDDQGDMCLQFGRTGKDEFILDVKWPLSPFQAFALALSSFDSKVGCD
mmetsp:Transcript_6408/g.10036  ORF Transcript_6408/g.10036 Transcript_6408/m.10036 type:complete len:630 (-) Transcript_6408:57-1946(-)